MRKTTFRLGLLAAASLAAAALPMGAVLPVAAAEHATILMYHRFGEDRIPSTNIRLEQFEAHLAELTSGQYRVLPLPEIVAKLKKGEPLPDRAVALTADDAYLSIATEGWPRIKKAGLPFTLF
nr:chitin deacetylase [Ferrovibrio sp.]